MLGLKLNHVSKSGHWKIWYTHNIQMRHFYWCHDGFLGECNDINSSETYRRNWSSNTWSTRHDLVQYSSRSLMFYDVTRRQWVNCNHKGHALTDMLYILFNTHIVHIGVDEWWCSPEKRLKVAKKGKAFEDDTISMTCKLINHFYFTERVLELLT